MTRAKRLEPVQQLVEDVERRHAQALAALEQRLAEQEKKLRDLHAYKLDYEREFSQRAGQGISATGLRDYQAFLGRLSEAIRQQKTVVERVRAECQAERERWQEAARRSKALDHVVERWRLDARKAEDRREQLETDERAQRRRTMRLT